MSTGATYFTCRAHWTASLNLTETTTPNLKSYETYEWRTVRCVGSFRMASLHTMIPLSEPSTEKTNTPGMSLDPQKKTSAGGWGGKKKNRTSTAHRNTNREEKG